MNSSTSSFSQGERAATRFLVAFVLFAVLAETGFALLLPHHPGRHEVDRRLAEIATRADAPRNVLLSDSVSYAALDGIDLPADVVDLSSNQAIAVAGNLFLARRLLDRIDEIQRPGRGGVATLLYVVSPHALESNLDSERFKESYFTSVFTHEADIQAIADSLDRPDLLQGMRSAQADARFAFPSFTRRGIVIDPIVIGLRSINRSVRGTYGIPDEATTSALELIEQRARIETFEPSEVTAAFLPKLAALCAERGVTFLVAAPPIAPTLLAAWERNGYWAGYVSYLESIAVENETMRVAARPLLEFESDGACYDGVHLEPAAKRVWGQHLAELLKSDLTSGLASIGQ